MWVGKSFVCDHEDDANAQEVYKAVVDYYLKSTKASLDSAGLLSYITSICLGSGLWKGPTHSFVLHQRAEKCNYGNSKIHVK